MLLYCYLKSAQIKQASSRHIDMQKLVYKAAKLTKNEWEFVQAMYRLDSMIKQDKAQSQTNPTGSNLQGALRSALGETTAPAHGGVPAKKAQAAAGAASLSAQQSSAAAQKQRRAREKEILDAVNSVKQRCTLKYSASHTLLTSGDPHTKGLGSKIFHKLRKELQDIF